MQTFPRLVRRKLLIVVSTTALGLICVHFVIGHIQHLEKVTDLSLRKVDYPSVFIAEIHLDLTSPNHYVTLTWSGSKADGCETGPFRSSPGKGLGGNNCDDITESNRSGSNCTPKGSMLVEGIDDELPTASNCRFVTWFQMARSVAFHAHSSVPAYPVSHGCVRLETHAAQLIHDNVIVGKTVVVVDGKWTPPPVELDRGKLLQQLTKHEGKRRSVYIDSEGYPTIGIGFNLKRSGAQAVIEKVGANYNKVLAGEAELNDGQIASLFEADVDAAIIDCKKVFNTFTELSDVRQRVLVDMMFNLGPTRFASFRNMIAAIGEKDFDKAADEMTASLWFKQVKTRGTTLVSMMRTNIDYDQLAADVQPPIIDSHMTREEALNGLSSDCPQEIRNRQQLVEVYYYSFDNKLHQGQLLVDKDLVEEVREVFDIAQQRRFPIKSAIPMSHPSFRKNSAWDDEESMKANNTSAFNYRSMGDVHKLSLHALGRAVDINPVQNPYVNGNVVLPRNATHDPAAPGTFTADSAIVRAFLNRGWVWGGAWKQQKDYQHFEKPDGSVRY